MKKFSKKLPDSPGVYFFKKGKEVLYIGKATSLRNRVRSYFNADIVNSRGQIIIQMVQTATSVAFKVTNSVLEAVILEAEFIKRYQPRYNLKEKDNKSFNFVIITDEKYPRVIMERGRALAAGNSKFKIKKLFGPFPSGAELKEAMKITRKIFPFRDKCLPCAVLTGQGLPISTCRPCFNRQIDLCPGVCTGEMSEKNYKKRIRNIELLFSGKKKRVIIGLKKEMAARVRLQDFEMANTIKKQIFSLGHIRDVGLIKRELISSSHFRIEAYDVSHHGGNGNVGVMVAMEDGEVLKEGIRRFKIRGNYPADDLRSLREIIDRRLNHSEWRFPDLIVVDGGQSQKSVAETALLRDQLSVPVVGIVKNDKHKPERILGDIKIVKRFELLILLANSLAHRFAIAYHRKLFSKIK